MKVLSWRDPSSYGDLAESDDKRCASNRNEQPHVQCALGYRPTVIVVAFEYRVGGTLTQAEGFPIRYACRFHQSIQFTSVVPAPS